MINDFKYLGYKIEVYFNEKESNYFIYKDGQFLEKGKGYMDNRFQSNGLMRDAKGAVDTLVGKQVIKRRLGKFHQSFRDLR